MLKAGMGGTIENFLVSKKTEEDRVLLEWNDSVWDTSGKGC